MTSNKWVTMRERERKKKFRHDRNDDRLDEFDAVKEKLKGLNLKIEECQNQYIFRDSEGNLIGQYHPHCYMWLTPSGRKKFPPPYGLYVYLAEKYKKTTRIKSSSALQTKNAENVT